MKLCKWESLVGSFIRYFGSFFMWIVCYSIDRQFIGLKKFGISIILYGRMGCGDNAIVADNAARGNKRRRVSYGPVTVYYFCRSQGFTCVPTFGGSTLGKKGFQMVSDHFFSTLIVIKLSERWNIAFTFLFCFSFFNHIVISLRNFSSVNSLLFTPQKNVKCTNYSERIII